MFGFEKRDVTLVLNFFAMNVKDRYLGSTLGSIWGVANPLLMLGIFTFVFGYVYKIKLPGAETTLSYAIWLISGYGPWIATSEAIMNSTNSVVSAAGIVKNMAIKTELLPIAGALTGLLPLIVSLVFLAILLFVDGNAPTWHALFLLPVIVLQFLLIIAVGFFLAAVNVFVRDLSFAVPNLLLVLLFATPIFYPIESVPRTVQLVSQFNPFYILSEGYRQALVYHHVPGLLGLGYVSILSLLLALFGLSLFRRVKGYFEAVL